MLSKETLSPADLPYPADYAPLLESVERLVTHIADCQTELALPQDLRPTKADLKRLTRRTHRLSEAIGTIKHRFWAIKSKIKHRTLLVDGRLHVVLNEATGAQTLVQLIEAHWG
ncbi:MAG TPA: hypothetical protein VMV49_13785 [Candidatus Deferrimicrobium sp.]|nr:hypothetical protein [Candidatus Deferrimicrobium sp.]